MAFQSEALDGAGESATKIDVEDPAVDLKGPDEAHPQMDTQLEIAEGDDNDDGNEAWGSRVCGAFYLMRFFVMMLPCPAWASCDLETALASYLWTPFAVLSFYSLIYMNYLIFLRRLKHGETELRELNTVMWWLHRLFGCCRLKGKDRVMELRARVIIV
jgi:hypothetical protein